MTLPVFSRANISGYNGYRIEFPYSDANLNEVAAFVSKLYATFPLLSEEELGQLRKHGIFINASLGPKFTQAECDQFEIKLNERIITEVKESKFNSVSLSCDYCPIDILQNVAASVFNFNLIGNNFPSKSLTEIRMDTSTHRLRLNIKLKGYQ